MRFPQGSRPARFLPGGTESLGPQPLWQSERCLRTAQDIFVLDRAFALIEGHPARNGVTCHPHTRRRRRRAFDLARYRTVTRPTAPASPRKHPCRVSTTARIGGPTRPIPNSSAKSESIHLNASRAGRTSRHSRKQNTATFQGISRQFPARFPQATGS